jgi:hypothetical protein
MSWSEVDVSFGKETITGLLNDERLTVAAPKGYSSKTAIKSVSISGKPKAVASCVLDARDGVLNIILAMAGNNKEESDDQPDEGRDTS